MRLARILLSYAGSLALGLAGYSQGITPEMVFVKGGSFMMGSARGG